MVKSKSFKLSLVAAACMTAMSVAQAGKITGVQQEAPSPVVPEAQQGFGGWDLGNVDVKIVSVETGEVVADKTFNNEDGSYTPMVEGESFVSIVNDGAGNAMGGLVGKDWPVGEPSGVKVISNIDPDATYSPNLIPNNCIMSTSYHTYDEEKSGTVPEGALGTDGWLGSTLPNPTMCDSAFQTHKRFKVNALPATVDGVGAEAVDLVFNVEAGENRYYTVLQKLNNYTDKRLQGFRIEVGFGVGESFEKVSDTAVNEGGDNLKLSFGEGEGKEGGPILDASELAVFSAGLFGTADEGEDPKHPFDGFFDTTRAGFAVELSEDGSTISTTGTLGSNYNTIFGDWLPSIYEPAAIFWDDTPEDPLDDELVAAYWGDNPATDEVDYTWLLGNEGNFAPVDDATLASWNVNGEDSVYSTGTIEDVLNVGFTYLVKVGDVSSFPDSQFTIRMVPVASEDQTVPEYVDGLEPVVPVVAEEGATFTGTINTAPTSEVAQGSPIAIRVTDADLNTDPLVAETITVTVTNGVKTGDVTLTERGADFGVFEGFATGYTGSKGSKVTVTYADASDADGQAATVTETTDVAGSSSNSISAYDNVSLMATILGFIGLGAWVARRKLSK